MMINKIRAKKGSGKGRVILHYYLSLFCILQLSQFLLQVRLLIFLLSSSQSSLQIIQEVGI